MMTKRTIFTLFLMGFIVLTALGQTPSASLSGKIITKDKSSVGFATVYLKGTSYGCASNDDGHITSMHPPERTRWWSLPSAMRPWKSPSA